MSKNPEETSEYMLGVLNTKMDQALQDLTDLKALEPRITSLEQTRFRVYTIIATLGAVMGLIGSQIGKAFIWLKESLTA